jgi:hypothetical protein
VIVTVCIACVLFVRIFNDIALTPGTSFLISTLFFPLSIRSCTGPISNCWGACHSDADESGCICYKHLGVR